MGEGTPWCMLGVGGDGGGSWTQRVVACCGHIWLRDEGSEDTCHTMYMYHTFTSAVPDCYTREYV